MEAGLEIVTRVQTASRAESREALEKPLERRVARSVSRPRCAGARLEIRPEITYRYSS